VINCCLFYRQRARRAALVLRLLGTTEIFRPVRTTRYRSEIWRPPSVQGWGVGP